MLTWQQKGVSCIWVKVPLAIWKSTKSLSMRSLFVEMYLLYMYVAAAQAAFIQELVYFHKAVSVPIKKVS